MPISDDGYNKSAPQRQLYSAGCLVRCGQLHYLHGRLDFSVAVTPGSHGLASDSGILPFRGTFLVILNHLRPARRLWRHSHFARGDVIVSVSTVLPEILLRQLNNQTIRTSVKVSMAAVLLMNATLCPCALDVYHNNRLGNGSPQQCCDILMSCVSALMHSHPSAHILTL